MLNADHPARKKWATIGWLWNYSGPAVVHHELNGSRPFSRRKRTCSFLASRTSGQLAHCSSWARASSPVFTISP